MKKVLFAATVLAVIASTVSANAVTDKSQSKTIVVQSSSAVPVLGLEGSEAMYLQKTGDGRALLLVESASGTDLTILDVTDPAKIRRVAETKLGASSVFDFVEPIGDDNVLIRYRDGSGEAMLNVKHSNRPVLKTASAVAGTEAAEKLGETGLLSASTDVMAPIVQNDPIYTVWDNTHAAHPNVLATIPGVIQRLANEDTGTLFLLSKDGVTVVRRLRVEHDHKVDVAWRAQVS